MHIALLGPASSIHLQRWALALHARGWRVDVLTQHAQDALPLPAAVSITALPHQGQAGYLRNAWAVRRWLRAHRPQLLHAHYASGYGSTALLAGWRPTVLSVWGSDVFEFPRKSPMHRWLLARNLLAADALTSTSRCMAAQVRIVAPQVGAIAVVPFGVDLQAFESAPARAASAGPRIVGTVKTLDHKYGIDTLIQAFALLQRGLCRSSLSAAAPVRLRIVGSGPQERQLRQLAQRLGVADAVDFIGSVAHEQVPGELARLDVFVALSREESFGVAVVEACAAGLPVMVSDAGGLPEVVLDGQTGLVVPRDDPQAAASALARLLRDPGLRQRLGAAGRAHVERHYAWPACVQAMTQVYEATLAAHPRPGRSPA